jgi:DNA-directed RNA polymerase alpha subunit
MVTHLRPIVSAINVSMNLMEKQRMTKEELLDQYAIHAMSAQIANKGINGIYSISQEAYRMAELMWEAREQLYMRRNEEAERKRRYEQSDLSDLGLPVRYHNCLTCEDIWMKDDLNNWTERDLKRIPNLGAKGLQFVKQAMIEHGLKLKCQE